jgi:RNA polymerase sigma-70 factor (ECF subfamily)
MQEADMNVACNVGCAENEAAVVLGMMNSGTVQFEKLALDQMDTLYRVARRLTRDVERANDLVQETYLRAFRAKDSFELKEYGIRPWLLRIMQNLHFSRAGREKRQPITMEDGSLEAAELNAMPETAGVPLPINLENLDEQLVHALEGLAVDYQVVLLMWAVDDLTYKEIAHTLDIPIGTVMSRLHRARHKLGEQLRDYAVREGVIRKPSLLNGEPGIGNTREAGEVKGN